MNTSILSLILNEINGLKGADFFGPSELRPSHILSFGTVTRESAKCLYTIGTRYFLDAEKLLQEAESSVLSLSQKRELFTQVERMREIGAIAYELYWFECFDELGLFGLIPEGYSAHTFSSFEIGSLPDKELEMEPYEKVRLDLLEAPKGRLQ